MDHYYEGAAGCHHFQCHSQCGASATSDLQLRRLFTSLQNTTQYQTSIYCFVIIYFFETHIKVFNWKYTEGLWIRYYMSCQDTVTANVCTVWPVCNIKNSAKTTTPMTYFFGIIRMENDGEIQKKTCRKKI